MDEFEKSFDESLIARDDSQVVEKVKVKRNVGVLKNIKVLLLDKDLSVDEISQALVNNSINVSRNSLQSQLSTYVKKGLLVKTSNGYGLRKDA